MQFAVWWGTVRYNSSAWCLSAPHCSSLSPCYPPSFLTETILYEFPLALNQRRGGSKGSKLLSKDFMAYSLNLEKSRAFLNSHTMCLLLLPQTVIYGFQWVSSYKMPCHHACMVTQLPMTLTPSVSTSLGA